jgi:hypothetical protein
LEGGLEWSSVHVDEAGDDTLWCMAWMAVYGKRTNKLVEMMASRDTEYYMEDKKPIFGVAKTGLFALPVSIKELILRGFELGHADDIVFGRTESKRGQGTVGLLTNGIINRSAYYEHTLVLALIPWIRPDVYCNRTTNDEADNEDQSDNKSASTGGIFCTLFRTKK